MAAELGWPGGGMCLPPATADKKRRVERAAEDFLRSSGFRPIELPTLEYVSSDSDSETPDRCKFLAPDGRLLGLRYDHTSSLIRFIAANENMPLPARLFYSGPVFRRKKNVGYTEVTQIGAEILGVEGVDADIEIIRLLAGMLKAVGVSDCLIDIGTVEVFKGIVSGVDLDAAAMSDLREAILRKDNSELKTALSKSSMPAAKKNALENLPGWFGGKDVFDRASSAIDNERSRTGLNQLRKVFDTLSADESAGKLGARVSVDLGVVQSLDYYTGTVFEAYARRVGQPIASGGRYDRLGDTYGKSIPATGFALNTGLLLDIV